MVNLIGKGFQPNGPSDWHHPCSSIKRAHKVREKTYLPLSEEDWTEMFTAITDEHKAKGAREQLAAGWKAWL